MERGVIHLAANTCIRSQFNSPAQQHLTQGYNNRVYRCAHTVAESTAVEHQLIDSLFERRCLSIILGLVSSATEPASYFRQRLEAICVYNATEPHILADPRSSVHAHAVSSV